MEFVRFAEIALFFCLNLRDTVIKKMTSAHPAMTNREEGRQCPMKTVPYSPLPRRGGCRAKKDEDGGKIVQRGTHDELIQEDGIYADFVGGKKETAGWKL